MNSKDIKPWHERGSVNAGGWVQKDYAPKYNATEIVMLEEISELRRALVAAEDERDALKAELEAIKGAGEPVAWSVTMGGAHTGNVCGEQREAINLMNRLNQSFPDDKRAVVPLYTRPCVSLTDEKVKELICEHFVTGENLFNEVHQDYRFRSRATERNVWGRDLLAFARDVEAHIKGAK